ncbi:glycosyltransferase family 2 protein [Candidatus Microgenomates bacterium]|nr:glycosyltransferase family 2 protein [Candidatus Microgenomates bacterium]
MRTHNSKKTKEPKISLCIPNYNRAHDLLQVVKDCVNQTIEPYEIIIQDDRSNAEELRIIRKGLKLKKHMSFEVNKKNLGLAGNVNAVIKKAKGDYIAVVNNDDRISKYYVEEIINAIKKFPGYNVYTTNGMGMNEEGRVVGDYRLYTKDTIIRKREGIKKLWKNYVLNLITISGTSFYKSSYIKKTLFDIRLGNEADLDNALHMLATEDIVYIDKPVYYVRMHADQESTKIRATSERLLKYIQKCLQIYSKYTARFSAVPMYITQIKGVYFFQLTYKYHYDMKTVRKLLKITSFGELVSVMATIPMFIAQYALKLIKFKLYYQSYVKYFPE